MKIINLRFENLNSLRGLSPLIDFENGILADAGIFAITGSTGAGKTTILDAVCVALYGETPRLKKGGIGNLMSRHTGHCWSEVTFAVNGKYYRSRWAQHRANRKAGGNIQAPRMELAVLGGGEGDSLLAEKLSRVPRVVEELTGLNFKRFCRSMMLAQGEFAAFLNADENERAELLEKMTGTEIYAEISSRVFERNRAEHQALDDLKKSLDAMALMGEDDLNLLEQQLKALKEKLDAVELEAERARVEKRWLEEVASQEGIIERSRADMEDVQKEMESFGPDLGRLMDDARARRIITEFSILEKTRSGRTGLEERIAVLEAQIPGLKEEFEEKQKNLELKKDRYHEFLLEKEALEAVIPGVIKMDEDIRGRKESAGMALGQLEHLGKKNGKIREDILRTMESMDAVKESESESMSYLSEHQCDAVLLQRFSLLENMLLQLPGIHALILENESETALCVKENMEMERGLGENRLSLEAASMELQQSRDENRGLSLEFEKRSGNKSQDEWERLQGALSGRAITLQRLVDIEKETGTVEAELEFMEKEGKRLLGESVHLAGVEKKIGAAVGELEADIADLRQKRELELKIRDYEKDRAELKNGRACPLCGALEHPFAEGVPRATATTLRIKEKESALGAKNRELLSTGRRIAALGEKITGIDEKHARQNAALKKYRDERDELLRDGAADPDSIERELEVCRAELVECENILSDLRLIGRKKDAAVKKEAGAERKLSDARLEESRWDSKIKAGALKFQGLKEDMDKAAADLRLLESDLSGELIPLKLNLPERGDEKKLVELLRERKSSYESRVEKRQDCEKKRLASEKTLEALERQLTETLKAYEDAKDAFDGMEKEINSLVEERLKLFGNRCPEKEAAGLRKKEVKLAGEIEPMVRGVNLLEKDLAAKKALSLSFEEELKKLCSELRGMEDGFLFKLEEAGFETEAGFMDALLPEKELRKLESIKEGLEKRLVQARTRLRDAGKKVAAERERALTDKDMAVINGELAELSQKKSGLDQEVGKILNILAQQRQLRKKQGEKLAMIRAREKECGKWRKMNGLIGSADGRMFRRFAQGLTLEHLIRYANAYLESFGDRYLIKVVEDQDLGIEIVDLYQSDAVRPVNTLSGGESFLVSLALALGLSMLSSRRTRVESLFLDEGFGTLDNETLYTALQALHSIHASGKMIGIISHVDALKEQVPVQLHVKKRSGGVSEVIILG